VIVSTSSNTSGLEVNFRLGRRLTAQEVAYEAIRAAILRGDFVAGARLQQSNLASQLSVSTTPVREALSRLATEGLVQIDPHRGAIVRGFDDDELEEIYQLREILEPLATKKAALLISEEALDEAEVLWRRMEDHSDPAEWVENNRQFHALIASASHSPRLTSLLQGLRDSSTRYVHWSLTVNPDRFVSANRDHRALIDACRARDGELAAAIEARHLSGTVEALRLRRSNESPDGAPLRTSNED
jgi:DNA-binding GntR family transcriptional regulator